MFLTIDCATCAWKYILNTRRNFVQHGKNDFAEGNFAGYRSENNFVRLSK